ncbi:hypothetical protein NHX12_000658, partial [Muraenolepis orangiensis]
MSSPVLQVEEGTAKLDKDFTHSTASLIQFDQGVKVKTWTIYLHDDQLEENQESFSITLSNPDNAVLGPRHTVTVDIMDPKGGSCDPEDLKEDEGPITDIEAELLWDSHAPPARGDVPRPHDHDYVKEEPQDQPLQYHLRPAGDDRLLQYHLRPAGDDRPLQYHLKPAGGDIPMQYHLRPVGDNRPLQYHPRPAGGDNPLRKEEAADPGRARVWT